MQYLNNQSEPLLSVFMVTYNHEKYIRQSLQSVIDQKTSFPIELVIGEDCSTDGTRAIVREFEEKYPSIVKPIYHDQNVGPARNAYEFVYPRLKGKYIACLEGDDYWSDPSKLQHQVDFLENNPNYSICFHRAKLVYTQGVQESFKDINAHTPTTTTLHNIIKGNYIHTVTCVFRKHLDEFPAWFKNVLITDWVLHIFNAEFGNIYFIDKEMAVYRIHYGGLLSTKKAGGPHDINKMEMYLHLAGHFKTKDAGIYKWFYKLHHHQKAVYFGIQNVGQKTTSYRLRVLIRSAYRLKKPQLFFAALLMPFFRGDSLYKFWDKASRIKGQLSAK